MFETVLISANDELLNLYLKRKIKYSNIYTNLLKIINLKEFKKFSNKTPEDFKQISNLMEQVRLKTRYLCIK